MARANVAMPGQYLTMMLGKQIIAIPISVVREINKITDISPLPNVPKFIHGVMSLRGKFIPIVDLKLKFGYPETEIARETCVVIVECDHGWVGVLVDQIHEVVNLKEQEIESPPDFRNKERLNYLLGLGKKDGKICILLNIYQALSKDDFLKDFSLNIDKMVINYDQK